MQNTCAECAAYIPTPDEQFGTCHYYPPYTFSFNPTGQFPSVNAADTCMQFTPLAGANKGIPLSEQAAFVKLSALLQQKKAQR